jgi:hypothetical protein
MSTPLPYKTTVVRVTPELAKKWLANARRNRNITAPTVESYAYEMRAGLWRHNPDGIKFNPEGQLIDGRNRLSAIIESGVPVYLTVIHDVPEDVLPVLDRGRVRTTADTVMITEGDMKASVKSAIFSLFYRIERGGNPRMTIGLYHAIEEALGYEHVDQVCQASRNKIVSALATALVYARPINPEAIDELERKVVSRECMPGTEAAILRLTGDSRLLSADRSAACRRFMRGTVAYLLHETIDRLHDNTSGYRWLQIEREKRNLPSKVVPALYKNSSQLRNPNRNQAKP